MKNKNEAIDFDDDDHMIYDPSKDAEEITPLRTEDDVIRSTNAGVKYYYGYVFDFSGMQDEWGGVGNTDFARDTKLKYIKRLRYPLSNEEHIVENLVNMSVEKYINKKGLPKIIIPIASKSKINGWICDAFLSHDHSIIKLTEAIIKQLNKYIQIKKGIYIPTPARSAIRHLHNNAGDKEFEIKKLNGRFRQYISNFLTSNPTLIDDLKKIKGNDVLLIDDSINMGATLHDAIREISKYKPKSIQVFIFLKELNKYSNSPT